MVAAPPPAPREPKMENGYYVFDDVPVFDEHVGRDGVHYDARLLSAIAHNQNRRIIDTGDYTPVVAWHTREDGDQSRQPPLVGYAADFAVKPLGRLKPRPCIYARFYVLPDQLETFRRNPRRSVELWPEKEPERRFFDPIALQGADTPQRDLGLIYTRNGSPDRYRMYGHAIRYAIEGTEARIKYNGEWEVSYWSDKYRRIANDFPEPSRYARKKAESEGRWITIGANKDADPGEKGGTPVFIDGESGRITKGPDGLEGASLDDLKKPKPKPKTPKPKAAKTKAPDAKQDFPDAGQKKDATAAERIQQLLDSDDHVSAFEEFKKLKKADIDKTAREVFGAGFYNETKKQMLEAIEKNIHKATKSSIEAAERKDKESLLKKKLDDVKKSQQDHLEGSAGAPVVQDLEDHHFRDPHGAGKDAVAKAWEREVAKHQQALDDFLGKSAPDAKQDFPEPGAGPKDPSPEEIANRAAEVRKGWDDKTREERKVGQPEAPSAANGGAATPEQRQQTKQQILQAYKMLGVRSEYQDGLIDLPRMLAKAQITNPGLTKQEFHEAIMDLAKETDLQLRFANEPSNIENASDGLWYSPNENRVVDIQNEKNPPWDAGLYHYAYIHPDKLRDVLKGKRKEGSQPKHADAKQDFPEPKQDKPKPQEVSAKKPSLKPPKGFAEGKPSKPKKHTVASLAKDVNDSLSTRYSLNQRELLSEHGIITNGHFMFRPNPKTAEKLLPRLEEKFEPLHPYVLSTVEKYLNGKGASESAAEILGHQTDDDGDVIYAVSDGNISGNFNSRYIETVLNEYKGATLHLADDDTGLRAYVKNDGDIVGVVMGRRKT